MDLALMSLFAALAVNLCSNLKIADCLFDANLRNSGTTWTLPVILSAVGNYRVRVIAIDFSVQ